MGGRRQGKGEGDGELGHLDGHGHHREKGRPNKGGGGGRGSVRNDGGQKGYGRPDYGGYANMMHQQYHDGDGKGHGQYAQYGNDNYNQGYGRGGRGQMDNNGRSGKGSGGGGGGGGQAGGGGIGSRVPGRGEVTHGNFNNRPDYSRGDYSRGEPQKSLSLDLPRHEVRAAATPPNPANPQLWPITPLGLPSTPPPLPPANLNISGAFFMPTPEHAEQEAPSLPSDAPLTMSTGARSQQVNDAESFTPVDVQQSKKDRRTFFHGDGKVHTFNPAQQFRKVATDGREEIGAEIELQVEEVHFGNPRVRIRSTDPAIMPEMLKWPSAKFAEHALEVAEIDFGSYRVWSAIGIPANRLLYAMKRQNISTLNAVVVSPPTPTEEDEVDLTYGNSIQGIQLVP